MRIRTRLGEAVLSAALLAIGLAIVWQASRLRMGTPSLPGPAVLPLACGALLVLGALAGLLRSASLAASCTVELGNRQICLTILALAGFALAFEPLGAKLSIGLFLWAMLLFLSETAWWKALLAAAIASAAVWYGFTGLLGVRLPVGIV